MELTYGIRSHIFARQHTGETDIDAGIKIRLQSYNAVDEDAWETVSVRPAGPAGDSSIEFSFDSAGPLSHKRRLDLGNSYRKNENKIHVFASIIQSQRANNKL